MNKVEKYAWLADIYAGAAEGGVIQYHPSDTSFVDRAWEDRDAGPNASSNSAQWRLKPDPVPVDLLGLRNGIGLSPEDRLIEAGFTVSVGPDHFKITGIQDGFCMPWEI